MSWDEIMDSVKTLSRQLPEDKTIYGLPRNGMIIAGLISHQRPDLKVVCQPEPDSIIIDDIHDTGKALSNYIKEGFFVATLFWRAKNPSRCPNVWAKTIHDN